MFFFFKAAAKHLAWGALPQFPSGLNCLKLGYI